MLKFLKSNGASVCIGSGAVLLFWLLLTPKAM